MDLERFFTPADRARIRAAVGSAEQETAGEIVPYVVASCDPYDEAVWKAATLAALAAAAAAAVLFHVLDLWGIPTWAWIALPPAFGGSLGLLLARTVAAVRRLLISPETLEHAVASRAKVAFLEEEVFRTRERTGILLFVALFEHRVLVLGDEGIHRHVAPSEWQHLVDQMVAEIRAGRPVEALVAGIERCGRLLTERRLLPRLDDVDELSDALRLEES